MAHKILKESEYPLLLKGFGEYLTQAGKLPSTVESYVRDAQAFLAYTSKYKLSLRHIEPATLIAFQEFLKFDLEEKDNSIRRTVIGIRQFFRYLTCDRRFPNTPFDDVPIPNRDDTLPKSLLGKHISSLLEKAAEGRPMLKAYRDVALLNLLAFEGLKANELTHLTWKDFLHDGHQASLAITHGRPRVILLSEKTREALGEYRDIFREALEIKEGKESHAHIFVAFKGRESTTLLPSMTRHGLKFVLYELGEKVKISPLNTELLRHYALRHLIDSGRTPEEIMQHLGLRRLGNIAKHLTQDRTCQPPVPEGAGL